MAFIWRQLLRQTEGGNLRFKTRQVFDEQLDDVGIEVGA